MIGLPELDPAGVFTFDVPSADADDDDDVVEEPALSVGNRAEESVRFVLIFRALGEVMVGKSISMYLVRFLVAPLACTNP